jgi:phage/plasmid-associated DNA primase
MFVKTMQTIYGAYFVDFPVSLLSSGGNKNSSSATPELAQAANSRAAILAEPDDRMSLSSGTIKRLTGGDRIFTRALHDNGGSMELTFKTIMVCNRIPTIASVDRATINRFVIIPFLGTWTDDAPETEEEQFKQRKFKLDPFFESKIPEMAKALLWVSAQYYTYYASEGLLFPPIISEYIKKHWDDNDHYLQFIAEKIDYAYKDGDKKEVDVDVNISAQELYKFFTPWFKDYFPGINVATLQEFRDDISMSGRLGPQPKRGVWLGIRLKNIVPELGGGVKI